MSGIDVIHALVVGIGLGMTMMALIHTVAAGGFGDD